MTDIEQALVRLLDERAAEQLLDRWSEAMDRNDWDGVEACLASEFTLLAPPVVTYAGPKRRAQAVAEIAARNEKVGGFHCLPTKSVSVNGDRAHVVARLVGGHWSPDKSAWEIAYGFYDIDLVREDGGWRIAKLSIDIQFSHGPGLFKKMAQQTGN